MISQVLIVTVTLFGYACATNYEGGYGGVGEKAVGRRHGRHASGGYFGGGINYPRKPHRLQYKVEDGQGNSHFRSEYGDRFGVVSGSYGYSNARGLYRVVDYIADARGFRANIKTNEPGSKNVTTFHKPGIAGYGGEAPTKTYTSGVGEASCGTGDNYSSKKCIRKYSTG